MSAQSAHLARVNEAWRQEKQNRSQSTADMVLRFHTGGNARWFFRGIPAGIKCALPRKPS
jgi:hypothetical protein